MFHCPLDHQNERANLLFFCSQWGGCCVLCFLFTYFCIPETKGLSLEQVDILYRNSSIRKSNTFRKQILDENMGHETRDAYGAPKNNGTIDHKEKADVEMRDV